MNIIEDEFNDFSDHLTNFFFGDSANINKQRRQLWQRGIAHGGRQKSSERTRVCGATS